ncbi:unnamed protein product [Ectocarpus sp. 12 AP-2014]
MQAFVGIAALLAASPPCVSATSNEEHQPTHPLLSGSVCRVRDSLDFLSPTERAKVTLQKRVDTAKEEFQVGPTCHITNGDETNVPDFIGQFHKSLPHDKFGTVSKTAYQKLLDCVFSADVNVCDQVPSGASVRGAKMINPLGGTAHQVDGADSSHSPRHMHATPTTSVIQAAQMVEVYWMALTRDIPFSEFATNSLVRAAAGELHCDLWKK